MRFLQSGMPCARGCAAAGFLTAAMRIAPACPVARCACTVCPHRVFVCLGTCLHPGEGGIKARRWCVLLPDEQSEQWGAAGPPHFNLPFLDLVPRGFTCRRQPSLSHDWT